MMNLWNGTVATLLGVVLLLALIAYVWLDAVAFGLVTGGFAMAWVAILSGYLGFAIGILLFALTAAILLRRRPRRKQH